MHVLLRRRLRRQLSAAVLGLAALLLAPSAAAASDGPHALPLRIDITRGADPAFTPHVGPYVLAGAADFSVALSTIMDGRNALCLEIQGGKAYIGTADGLSIYDVSDPADPVYLGGTNGWIYAVDVSGGYAYVKVNNDTDNNYLVVLDVSDPANPKVVTFINPPAIPHEPSQFPPQLLFNDALLVHDGYLYVGCEDFYNNDFSWRALDVYDVSDPSAPVLWSQPAIAGNVDRMVVQGDHLYLGEGEHLQTVHIADPAAAAVTSTIETPTRGLAVDGRYLFSGNYLNSGEVKVYDLTNPASPAAAGTIECKASYLLGVDDLAIVHPAPGKSWLVTAWNASPSDFEWVEVMDVTPPLRFGEQSLLGFQGDVANVTNNRVNAVAADGTTIFLAQEYAGVRVSSLQAPPPDQTSPVTTISGVDAKWHRSAVTVGFSVVDEVGGSGVGDIYYALDDGGFTALGYPAFNAVRIAPEADHSFDGPHDLWYAAVDNAGNVETVRKATIRLDTLGPVTKALQSVSVRRGARVTVRYHVDDTWSTKANVTIKIKTLGGRTVKGIPLGLRATDRSFSTSFICRLPRGSYRYFVYAKDLAGNPQSVLGRTGFRVR